jgi:hypothetical protein
MSLVSQHFKEHFTDDGGLKVATTFMGPVDRYYGPRSLQSRSKRILSQTRAMSTESNYPSGRGSSYQHPSPDPWAQYLKAKFVLNFFRLLPSSSSDSGEFPLRCLSEPALRNIYDV